MKKLLCILLSLLLMLSFAACESEDDDDDRRSSRRSKKGEATSDTDSGSNSSSDYEDAIELMMKVYECDISKSELKSMFPDVLWDYFEEEEGMTLDDCYDMISEGLEDERADLEEEFGEDFKIEYKILSQTDVDEDEFEEFKEYMEEYYGMDTDSFGACYEVEIKGTISGENDEETSEMTYHVVEFDGSWYIAEILMDGFA